MLRINDVRLGRISAAGLFLTLVIAVGVVATDARFAPAAAGWTDSGKYAAIVIDANTDEVMFARNADAPRYPASLTKIMTLYMLFEELRAGRTSLDAKITFSKHAASQPPSKLGLGTGGKITVKNAIMMLVTKSANDVAAAVGEHIAGTESAFARRMTAKARALGMKSTTFRNASGLPNSGQKTTARDMATLARAIMDNFPEEYAYFKTRSFAFNGRYYRNHNRLLGRVAGVDGIKTGYINASGFNLTTSARRGEKHLIAVVMGGPTGRTRDNHMAALIERYFPRASNWPRIALPKIAPLPPRRDVQLQLARAAIPVPPIKPVVLAADEQTPAAASAYAEVKPRVAPAGDAPESAAAQVTTVAAATKPSVIQPAAETEPEADVESEARPTLVAEAKPKPMVVEEPVSQGDAEAGDETAAAPRGIAPMPVPDGSVRALEDEASANARVVNAAMEAGEGDAGDETGPVRADAEDMTPILANASSDPIGSLLESETTIVRSSGPAQSSIAASDEPEPVTADREVTSTIARRLTGETWLIQIGAYDNETAARERLQAAKEKSNLLESRLGYTEPVDIKSATLYRARFAGFDRDDAQRACKALKKAKFGCLPLKQ